MELGVQAFPDAQEGEALMSKRCKTCHQSVAEKPEREDQSCNGVKVVKYRFKNGGTVVDASCQCFGHLGRVHSSESCPLLLRARTKEVR
jgi:hypothetical protein